MSKDLLTQFNLFECPSGNYNTVVAGKGGIGKTKYIEKSIDKIMLENGSVFIFDIGGSFKRICQKYNGLYIDVNADFKVNPFLLIDAEESEIHSLAYLVNLMSGIGNVSEILVESVFKVIKDYQGNASLSRVYAELTHTELINPIYNKYSPLLNELIKSIEPYIHNFHTDSLIDGIDLTKPLPNIIVFDFDSLNTNPKLMSIMQKTLLFIVSQLFKHHISRAIKKICVINEFYDFHEYNPTEINYDLFMDVSRWARLTNGAIVTVTQSISDFYKRNCLSYLYNSDYKILFQHNNPKEICSVKEESLLSWFWMAYVHLYPQKATNSNGNAWLVELIKDINFSRDKYLEALVLGRGHCNKYIIEYIM